MTQPLVSVLMPMRNAEAYVQEALQSILSQDYPNLEVVVVDDGSTDSSRQKALALGNGRVRVVPGPQQGISAAVNCALHAAKGDIIMRCDSDDRFTTGRLSHQVGLLQQNPTWGAVCGAYRTIDPAGRLAAELCLDEPAADITERLLACETPTHLCTFAIRAPLLQTLGGCREAFVTAEDIDLQLRLAEVAKVWFDPTPVYEYRLHHSSITHSQADTRRVFYEKLARDCRQQRAAGEPDCVERGQIPAVPTADGGAKSSANHLQGHLLAQAWRFHGRGQQFSALRYGLRAVRAQPRSVDTWKSLAALTVKTAVKTAAKRVSGRS